MCRTASSETCASAGQSPRAANRVDSSPVTAASTCHRPSKQFITTVRLPSPQTLPNERAQRMHANGIRQACFERDPFVSGSVVVRRLP
jgi:hypothetical protein